MKRDSTYYQTFIKPSTLPALPINDILVQDNLPSKYDTRREENYEIHLKTSYIFLYMTTYTARVAIISYKIST